MGNVMFGADSRLDQDTLTASVAADANFPVSNLNDDRAFTLYKMGSTATELLVKTDEGVGDFAIVDYFMLVGHDLSDPDSDGNGAVLVEFQHSSDDITYTTIFSVTPTDDKIIVRSFFQIKKQFFRLRLTRGTAFKASLGELQWGRAVRPGADQPFDGTPGQSVGIGVSVGFDPNDETIEGQFNRSRTGQLMGAVRTISMRRARVRLELLDGSFVNDTTDPTGFKFFWDTHASKLKPFLFWWNDGNPGPFEKDAFFAIIDPGAGINRPLRTQLNVGRKDLEFAVIGVKE